MKKLKKSFLYLILIIFFLPLTVHSKMYIWTDENGVKHVSNTAPPQNSKNIQQKDEKAFDEEKHQRLMEQRKFEEAKERQKRHELKAAEKERLAYENERKRLQENLSKINEIDPMAIELEKERLKNKIKIYKEVPGSKLAIKFVEMKIELLEKNPEQYFYNLSIKR